LCLFIEMLITLKTSDKFMFEKTPTEFLLAS
jgi:hypothetical protein